MKHPAPEEWMAWLYGEVTAGERKSLTHHLDHCAECRAQVAAWRGTMSVLDEMPAPVERKRIPAIPLQWAAAAALLLVLGIAVGGLVFSSRSSRLDAAMQQRVDQQVAAARAELTRQFEQRETEIIAQLAAAADAKIASNAERLAGEFTKTLEETRNADRQTYLIALKELSLRYDNEIATLRNGIETVVALADYGFEATEQRLAQLAAATQSSAQE